MKKCPPKNSLALCQHLTGLNRKNRVMKAFVLFRRKESSSMTGFAEGSADDVGSQNDAVLMPDPHALVASNILLHTFPITGRARSIDFQILFINLDTLAALALTALHFFQVLLPLTDLACVANQPHLADEVKLSRSLAIRAGIFEGIGSWCDVETAIFPQLLNQDRLLQS